MEYLEEQEIEDVLRMINSGLKSRASIAATYSVKRKQDELVEEYIIRNINLSRIFELIKAYGLVTENNYNAFTLTDLGTIIYNSGGYMKFAKNERLKKENEILLRQKEVEAAQSSANSAEKSFWASVVAIVISIIALIISICNA